jgi:hypothetical protein
VVILIWAAQGLEVGCIVPLAGFRLLGHRREGTSNRDFIKSTRFEAIYLTSIAKVLEPSQLGRWQ